MRIDAVLTGGRIWTGDLQRPAASRIGLLNGMIVGLDDDLDGVRAAATIDLAGTAVLPGFHDAHCHTTSYGLQHRLLDLQAAVGMDAILAAVSAHSADLPRDSWVIGVGYARGLGVGEHPDAAGLDAASGGRPVWLTHASGHMCVVSRSALALLRGWAGQSLPAGFGRDGDGTETGLLTEFEMDVVKDFHGPGSIDDLVGAIDAATRTYAADGITAFTDAGIGCPGIDHSPLELAAYQAAHRRGLLHARAHLMVYSELLHPIAGNADDPARLGLDLGLHTGLGDGMVSVGAVKIWLDGSGIGDTAARSNHADGGRGDLVADRSALHDQIVQAGRSGWQVAVHAMGDAAVDLFLDALDVLEAEAGAGQRRLGNTTPRHRIEHGGLIRDDQVSRLASHGVFVATQPCFIAEFGDRLRETLLDGGRRVGDSFRVASLLAAGMAVAGSSDRPVSPSAPLAGIQAMVERLTETGWVYGDSGRVDLDTALRAFTLAGAYGVHAEHRRGMLRPGLDGDLVILADDPTTVEVARIGQIPVVGTLLGGRTTYDRSRLLEPLAEKAAESHRSPTSETMAP
jgi:predicted amidohydrolase YtcJ